MRSLYYSILHISNLRLFAAVGIDCTRTVLGEDAECSMKNCASCFDFIIYLFLVLNFIRILIFIINLFSIFTFRTFLIPGS